MREVFLRNKNGEKSSKVDFNFSFQCFFLAHDQTIFFFFIPTFAFFDFLSHFGWIFHAKLAHSSSSSDLKKLLNFFKFK